MFPITAACFISATQTGTGSAQNVAHDLGVIPGVVMIVMDSTDSKSYTLGTHTNKNVVVTVTNAATFKVVAFPPSPVNGR